MGVYPLCSIYTQDVNANYEVQQGHSYEFVGCLERYKEVKLGLL